MGKKRQKRSRKAKASKAVSGSIKTLAGDESAPEALPPENGLESVRLSPTVRGFRHLLIAVFLAAQFGIPISYYAGDRIFDERFSWRMFSPIRMIKCDVAFAVEGDSGLKPLRVDRIVAQPWVSWMKRGHTRVVDAFIDFECDRLSNGERLRGRVQCPMPDNGGTLTLLEDGGDLCERDVGVGP